MNAAIGLQRFGWERPEWWTTGLCGAAWLAMCDHTVRHLGHAQHLRMGFPAELGYWIVMAAAMMLPFAMDAVRVTAEASLWRRRHRAIAGFLCGYLGVWVLPGAAGAWLRAFDWGRWELTTGMLFGVAALWQCCGVHRRAVVTCHLRVPIAPAGWQADVDCVRYGMTMGWACVRSCWAMMLACLASGHAPVAMLGALAVAVLERRYFEPRWREALAGTLALGAYYLVAGV